MDSAPNSCRDYPVAITAGELSELLGCRMEGNSAVRLTDLATIEEAGPEHLTFLANPRYRSRLASCRAGAIIIDEKEITPAGMTRLVSKQPYIDFQRALMAFYPISAPSVAPGIHPSSVIAPEANIGADVGIGAMVVVEAGAVVGDRTVLFPHSYIGHKSIIGSDCVIGVNAVIRHKVTLGSRVVIGDGAVIGYDGFGYAPTPGGYRKIPQVGAVVIEDDVEIGANGCIDRATIGTTRIKRGVKLDNLIQIAHGVQIGEHTVIAAQTGISGSTRIGAWVMMGGQAGLTGHIEIGDKMIIGAQAGVTKSFDIKGMISGYPARPQMEAMRIEAAVSQLPELLKRMRALEKKLEANTSGDANVNA
ncbi:MAG: UDP-3-O-(3-hydroxymyristoyl)glucosamine N-acyltransferase [Calditrichaeota bacterium]|nr:UDP-3-O-(3-hydroxymyristoyl)glucosamine N-acyltransferase [Calditrichota bacterium]